MINELIDTLENPEYDHYLFLKPLLLEGLKLQMDNHDLSSIINVIDEPNQFLSRYTDSVLRIKTFMGDEFEILDEHGERITIIRIHKMNMLTKHHRYSKFYLKLVKESQLRLEYEKINENEDLLLNELRNLRLFDKREDRKINHNLNSVLAIKKFSNLLLGKNGVKSSDFLEKQVQPMAVGFNNKMKRKIENQKQIIKKYLKKNTFIPNAGKVFAY